MVMVKGLSPTTYMRMRINNSERAPYYFADYLNMGFSLIPVKLPDDLPYSYGNVMQRIWMLHALKVVFDSSATSYSMRQRHNIMEKQLATLARERCKTK